MTNLTSKSSLTCTRTNPETTSDSDHLALVLRVAVLEFDLAPLLDGPHLRDFRLITTAVGSGAGATTMTTSGATTV